MPFFSVLRCLRSSAVLLCCLPLSPFFSLFSSLLFPFFSILLSFSWKLALRWTKTTGAEASALNQWLLLLGTAKAMATPVLVSVRSLLLLMLSPKMTKMMAMKACCAGGVVGLASVFSLLSTVSFLWLSLPCLSLVSFCFSFLVFSVLSLFLMVFTVMKGKKETPYVLCILYLLPLFSFRFLSAAPSFTFQWRLFSIKENPPFFLLVLPPSLFFLLFFSPSGQQRQCI